MRNKISKLIYDKANQKRYASWLAHQIRPYLRPVLCLLFLRSFIAVLGVWKAVVEKLIVDRAASSLSMNAGIALAVGVMLMSLGLSALSAVHINTLQEKFAFDVRCNIYEKILKAVWSKLQKYHSEELLTRLTSDVNIVTKGIVNILVTVAALAVQMIAAFLLLVHYDWHLAVFIMILSPVAALAGGAFGIRLKEIQVRYQEAESKYRVYLQEHIFHITVIKAFTGEEASVQGLRKLRDERLYWVKKKNLCTVLAGTCISAAFSGGYLAAFLSGARQIASGKITYGTMTAFLSLVSQIQSPVYSLAQTLPQIVAVLASAGRVMELENMESETQEKVKVQEDPAPGGGKREPVGILAWKVTFSYEENQEILREYSMNILPGNIAVIMGHSGVGKTTLIRMLLGFIKPDTGDLFFYDRQGNRVEPTADARKIISYVPQGNTLFQGSIAENLSLGKADATREEMKEVLEAASVWEFVSTLPKGIYTILGEKAAGISEGQAQRIAIARALLKECSLLILDEATSALDEETEEKILKYLGQKKDRPTCFVVTHRSAVKKYADQILVLKEPAVLMAQKRCKASTGKGSSR